MSSDLRKTILNTRERWTSSKYNKQVQIHDRNLQEAMRHMLGSDEDLSGVISGLVASVNLGTFNVTVGDGLALLFDATKVAPDSQYRWIEIETPTTVTVPAADPVNPRWDVIEIAPGVASTGLLSRDIFDPTLGTFTSQNVTVEEAPSPTVQVRSGTAAASPALPAGVTGQLPLAYVFVPAAAGALNTDDTILCRPILRASGLADEGAQGLGGLKSAATQGGGIEVPSDGTTLRLRDVAGRFNGHRIRWGVPEFAALTLAANMVDGGALPGTDDVLYLYAVPPPYPAGYDSTIAEREFIPQSGSLAAGQFASYVPGSVGLLAVASTVEPDEHEIQGQPSIGGSGTIADPPFGGAASSSRSAWHYIGAISFDQGTGNALEQHTYGARIVTPLGPTQSYNNASLPINNDTFSLWSAGTNRHLLPNTALVCHVEATAAISGGPEAAEMQFTDETGLRFSMVNMSTDGAATLSFPFDVFVEENTGNMTTTLADDGGLGAGQVDTIALDCNAYTDAILDRR